MCPRSTEAGGCEVFFVTTGVGNGQDEERGMSVSRMVWAFPTWPCGEGLERVHVLFDGC